MKNVFEAEGPLRDVDPLAALVTCWREKTGGALRFTRGAAESGFDLEDGEVVGVVSSDPRFETAAILVRAGKLAADAVERLSTQGEDPALAALQTGLLTRREWKWGEKIRAIEVLSDLLSWNDGTYRFDASARPRGGEFRLPVPRLLLELFLRSRDRNLIEHQIGPPEQTLVRGERFDVEFASFGLTADAESVVHLIDGRSTASEIAARAPADEFAVRKLLAALVTLGLVHPVPARPPERHREAEPLPEPERELEPEPEPPTPPFPSAESPPVSLGEIDASDAATRAIPSPADLDLPGASDSPLERFDPSGEPAHWEPPAEAPRPETGGLWESTPEPVETIEAESDSPARRRVAPLVWGLGLLGAAVVAVLWWRGRSSPPPAPAAAVPTAAAPAATFPPPVTAARVEPTRPATAPQGPTPAPTAGRAAESPKPPAAVRQEPAARPAASTARETWNRRAQRDRQRLNGDKRTRYAIQLELVCEVASLEEAWKHDRGETMWLLSTSHAGRDCYRVFWGRYPSLDAAKRAKDGIPSYFVTPRNRPAVVAVR
jgi:hypothetical protein